MARSFEDIANSVYPHLVRPQPAPEKPTAPLAAETPPEETEPKQEISAASVARDLISGNDRLMQLLEADIAELEAAELADEAAIRRNMEAED